MPQRPAETPEVIVLGAGPAGLACALALAETGTRVTLAGLTPPPEDNRTTALLGGSVSALERLGVWSRVAAQAAPLRTLRLVDATHRLVRAPEVAFEAHELGLEAFGWNIANRPLVAALLERVRGHPEIRLIETRIEAVEIATDGATVRLATGDGITARLVAAADGRKSLAREAAGIAVTKRSFPQVAVTLNLAHVALHEDASTEFHTGTGPFTLVPLPGHRSSLVAVVSPAEAESLMAMDDPALALELERRSGSLLGALTIAGGRAAWPLAVETPARFAANRVALVGEAAHVVPPIGAQGLNMGLRDGAALAEIVAEALEAGSDPGGADTLARYDRARRLDVLSRTLAIETLNRSLLSPLLPVHAARGAALWLLDRVGPLRRLAMREGQGPSLGLPRLMRGEMS